jgi:hypothetical protein
MKRVILLAFMIYPVMFSCDKNKIRIDPDNLLIGVWNYADYQQNTMVYARQKEFTRNPGYKFNADGTLLERKNAGWCGTPPISYADYTGTWTILNDTLIQIKDGYWGGTTDYRIDIESVTEDSLKINMIFENN